MEVASSPFSCIQNHCETRIRVLHLEDNPLDAELIRRKLGAAGLASELIWVTDKESFESTLG